MLMHSLVLLPGHNLWQAALRHAHDDCLQSCYCAHVSTAGRVGPPLLVSVQVLASQGSHSAITLLFS